jgi:hypothetical protein
VPLTVFNQQQGSRFEQMSTAAHNGRARTGDDEQPLVGATFRARAFFF